MHHRLHILCYDPYACTLTASCVHTQAAAAREQFFARVASGEEQEEPFQISEAGRVVMLAVGRAENQFKVGAAARCWWLWV